MIEEYKEYYLYLEDLRQSGITNMYGASPYLQQEFPELTREMANNVLTNWMTHYAEIADWLY